MTPESTKHEKAVRHSNPLGMQHQNSSNASSASNKPRLLIATDNFLPRWDGISRFLAEIIPRLKDEFEITVLAPDFGATPAEKSSMFKLLKMPLSSFSAGDFPLANPNAVLIRKAVRDSDIVFVQTIGPLGLSSIKIARKENKKVVSFIHSIEWELVTRAMGIESLKHASFAMAKAIVRRIYRKVDLLIFPAQSIAELFTWHQINTPKEVIHLGVDTKKFSPASNTEEFKEKAGLPRDSFVIGYHGRIAREKDLLTLLRAFILVKKTKPDTKLLIVGDGLESIKRKFSRVQGVVLVGSTNLVVPYVQAMDVFCLPSLTETTSLTTLEAMACGIPVVVNKVGFVKDYVQHKKNGLFFASRDSYDLAKQILLLMRDADLRKRLGDAGRKLVEKEFDWDVTAKKLINVLAKMLQGNDK